MFRAHVLIIRRSKLRHTASGIVILKQVIDLKLLNTFYKYEQIVVTFMCEFFGCDYCVLLTVNMLCHVEVMFIQLLNVLEGTMSIKVNRSCTFLICLLTG